MAFVTLAALAMAACGQPETEAPASTAKPVGSSTAMPLPTAISNTPTVEPVLSVTAVTVATSEIARVGEAAPDFELDLFDGNRVRLSDFKGKVVVLNFWASWCPPCRKEMPAFERTWQEYRDQGVVFVGVAVQDYEADSRAFAREARVGNFLRNLL